MIFISCSTSEIRVIDIYNDTKQYQTITIKNTSNKVTSFELYYDSLYLTNHESILDFITNMPKTNPKETLALKAFRFVCNYTWHDNLVTKHSWAYAPYIMLNSFGGGLCGFRSATLTNILRDLGYIARSICINGHVVTELVLNNKNVLLDPDLSVYYYNDHNLIASYQELIDNPNLITQPINPLLNEGDLSYNVAYSNDLAQMYTSTLDNHDYSIQYDTNIDKLKLIFTLPADAILTFPIYSKHSFFYTNCKLQIPANYIGKINIPLVIEKIEGNAKIKFLSNEVKQFNANVYINNNTDFNYELEILENSNGLTIYYYLNPLIYVTNKHKDKLILKGKNIKNISISITNNTYYTYPYQKCEYYDITKNLCNELSKHICSQKELVFDKQFAKDFLKEKISNYFIDSIKVKTLPSLDSILKTDSISKEDLLNLVNNETSIIIISNYIKKLSQTNEKP